MRYRKTIDVYAEYWDGPGPHIVHVDGGGVYVAKPGSYIVYGESDYPIILSKEVFEQQYEEIGE